MRSNLPPAWNNVCSLTLCSPRSPAVGLMAGSGQGPGLWPSGPWRTLTSKHRFSCHNNTSTKSLDRDVRTLDFQITLASGVKEENFCLPIPCFEKISWCLFLSPLPSPWSQALQFGRTFLKTTLEPFFLDTSLSGIFCKICSGHAGVPVGET